MKQQILGNVINLMGIRQLVMLSRSDTNPGGRDIMMKAITAEQEKSLDRQSGNKNIYFYGDVNLEAKDDLDTIKSYNIIFNNNRGMLYSTFNYANGTFKLVQGEVKWSFCTDPIAWFKYNHCLLGKPAKVLVYSGYIQC